MWAWPWLIQNRTQVGPRPSGAGAEPGCSVLPSGGSAWCLNHPLVVSTWEGRAVSNYALFLQTSPAVLRISPMVCLLQYERKQLFFNTISLK